MGEVDPFQPLRKLNMSSQESKNLGTMNSQPIFHATIKFGRIERINSSSRSQTYCIGSLRRLVYQLHKRQSYACLTRYRFTA